MGGGGAGDCGANADVDTDTGVGMGMGWLMATRAPHGDGGWSRAREGGDGRLGGGDLRPVEHTTREHSAAASLSAVSRRVFVCGLMVETAPRNSAGERLERAMTDECASVESCETASASLAQRSRSAGLSSGSGGGVGTAAGRWV